MPAKNNWFLNFDEDEEVNGKSFLLQLRLEDIVREGMLVDTTNTNVKLMISESGSHGPWKFLGQTSTVYDDPSPNFPDGFRIFYEHESNLTEQMIRATCRQHREGLVSSEEIVGEAEISIYELVRSFGTRVKLELLRPRNEKICGRIEFTGEALPGRSPRGGNSMLNFRIRLMQPPKDLVQSAGQYPTLSTPKVFIILSRERVDENGWNCVYRSAYCKRGSTRILHGRRSYMTFPSFTVLQKELALGQDPHRRVRFEFYHKQSEVVSLVGVYVLSIADILNLKQDSHEGLCVGDELVGEVVVTNRKVLQSGARESLHLEIDVNYLQDLSEIRKQKRQDRQASAHEPGSS